jgi:hypothetical protein
MIDLDQDEREQAEAQAKAAKVRAEYLANLASLLEYWEFRNFMWMVLGETGYFGASFTGEPLTTAFNEGKRHIGIQLFIDMLTADPNAYTVMRNEALQREQFNQPGDNPNGD